MVGEKMQSYRGPWRIAHRGLMQAAPENSLEAFVASIEAGYEGIELDVRLTKDGKVAVIHDSNLTRLTVGMGEKSSNRQVVDMDASELQAIELPYANHLLPAHLPEHSEIEAMLYPMNRFLGQATGHDYESVLERDPRTHRILLLEELFDYIVRENHPTLLEIEIKAPLVAPKVFDLIQRYELWKQAIVFSGQPELMEEILEVKRQSEVLIAANLRRLTPESKEWIEDLMREGISFYEIGLNAELFGEEECLWLKERNIKVFSNLGDYPRWWERINELEIDGFKTNYPEAYTRYYFEHFHT